jgi:hypothetical protein
MWTLYVHVTSNGRDDHIRLEASAREDRLKAAQTDLERRFEQLRTYEHQLDVIPRAIDLLKEASCASDFLALTLLRETRSVIDGQDPLMPRGDIGLAATKAAFRLLSIRQDHRDQRNPYCTCPMLESIRTDFVARGEDKETAILAATALDEGAKQACQGKEAESLKSAADLRGQGFSVVFVNANDCAILKSVYRKAREALASLGEEPAKLTIASGHNGKVESQVVAFGEGNLSLDQASDLVARLRRQPGIRDDIYWAHKLAFGKSSCPQ